MRLKTIFAASALFVLFAFTAQAAHAQKTEKRKAEIPKNTLVGLPDLVITNAKLVDSDEGRFEVTLMNKGKGKAPWGVQTAKPLFIGSIPIAASNLLNNLGSAQSP